MADPIKDVSEIPESDWLIAARAANKSVEEVQKSYSDYVTNNKAVIEKRPIRIECLQSATDLANIKTHFTINVWVLEAEVEVTGHYNSEYDFDLHIRIELILLGINTGWRDIHLTPSHHEFCMSISAGPVGVSPLCLGISDNQLYLRGTIELFFGSQKFFVNILHF